MKRIVLITVLLAAVALTPQAAAEEEGAFTGSFQLGFREVDVEGSLTKYEQHYGLEDGPRLFLLDVKYVPEDVMRKYADRVLINMNNFGGDPYETLHVAVQKFGRYALSFDRRKSTYFYEDIILPLDQAGDPALALAGDFHHFDFDRVHDRADLKIWLNERAQLNFGLNRYTKKGSSTTTLDISRDEFELDKPIDESLNDYLGGFQYSWEKITLAFEQRYRDYRNVVEIFLPGRSLGEDPEDPTILDYYFLDQPYDFTSNDSIFRVVAHPNKKLLVSLQADLQSLDLDVDSDETGAGIDFAGLPLEIDQTGTGGVERDLELLDLDLSYRFTPRWALIFGARGYTLDQSGDVVFDDGGVNRGRWDIDTSSFDLGAQFAVSPKITVAGGLREESRDVDFSWSDPADDERAEKVSTDQSGYFFDLGWTPVKNCNLTFVAEDSSFDNPFALTSPTDRQRYKLRGRYRTDGGFSVLGSWALNEVENTDSGWTSDFDQLDLRLGYQRGGLNATLGVSSIDVKREIFQVVETLPGFGGGQLLPFDILYEADTTFFDARVRYDVDDRWAFGLDLREYDNDGSFGHARENYGGWIEAGIGQYVVHLGYRTIDYDEADFDFDDYTADIAEISIGYRW